MKALLLTLAIFFSIRTFSQEEKGMHFIHGLSWQQVKDKAKSENRYIFVDAFTTWCGPCRMMAKNIFPLPETGSFYNANYINLKVQLDTTAKDNDEVKRWYADAHDMMVRYGVNVFPTYLFFSPDGNLVHRSVGASDASTFINKGKDALNPDKQYYTLVERYRKGERESAFLKSLAEASADAYDRPATPVFSAAYISTQTNMLTEDNVRFLDNMTQSSQDPGFDIILNNTAAYNKIMGQGKAESKIKEIILNEEVYPVLNPETKPDWQQLQDTLSRKYPSLAGEITANAKVVYYYSQQDWPAFSKSVTDYLNQFGNHISANELNNYAWKVFENCDDTSCINQALEWSKKSVDLTNSPEYIDTYAALLYKTGKKEEAIAWEEKAVKLIKASKVDDSDYQKNLEKMKKGEKTW